MGGFGPVGSFGLPWYGDSGLLIQLLMRSINLSVLFRPTTAERMLSKLWPMTVKLVDIGDLLNLEFAETRSFGWIICFIERATIDSCPSTLFSALHFYRWLLFTTTLIVVTSSHAVS